MNSRDKLRSDLTRLLDEAPCAYEVVIGELERQLRWFKREMKREMEYHEKTKR